MEQFTILPITWSPVYQKEIEEIYRMLKDQEHKIFDLTWYDMGGNILNYVEGRIKEDAEREEYNKYMQQQEQVENETLGDLFGDALKNLL